MEYILAASIALLSCAVIWAACLYDDYSNRNAQLLNRIAESYISSHTLLVSQIGQKVEYHALEVQDLQRAVSRSQKQLELIATALELHNNIVSGVSHASFDATSALPYQVLEEITRIRIAMEATKS